MYRHLDTICDKMNGGGAVDVGSLIKDNVGEILSLKLDNQRM